MCHSSKTVCELIMLPWKINSLTFTFVFRVTWTNSGCCHLSGFHVCENSHMNEFRWAFVQQPRSHGLCFVYRVQLVRALRVHQVQHLLLRFEFMLEFSAVEHPTWVQLNCLIVKLLGLIYKTETLKIYFYYVTHSDSSLSSNSISMWINTSYTVESCLSQMI